jgi:hypothetical protein
VVDPNKKEKKPSDAPPADPNVLMRKARDYISQLTKVLPTLPNLPAPDPYPGTWEQVRKYTFLLHPASLTKVAILGIGTHRCESARGPNMWYCAHVGFDACRPSLNERRFSSDKRRYRVL